MKKQHSHMFDAKHAATAYNHMQLENEIANELSREIQKEMDEGIIASILVETGWTSVSYKFIGMEHAVEIRTWMDDNCQGKVERLAGDFLFQKRQDAEWFILRWL